MKYEPRTLHSLVATLHTDGILLKNKLTGRSSPLRRNKRIAMDICTPNHKITSRVLVSWSIAIVPEGNRMKINQWAHHTAASVQEIFANRLNYRAFANSNQFVLVSNLFSFCLLRRMPTNRCSDPRRRACECDHAIAESQSVCFFVVSACASSRLT